MKNLYLELKEKQQKEYNEFPVYFAFGDKQFEELLNKLNLSKEKEADNFYGNRLTSIGFGGIVLTENYHSYLEMINNHKEEQQNAMNDEKTGQQYIVDMFVYELNNHEYSYTQNISDTLAALRLTPEQINSNEKLRIGLAQAIDEINKEHEEIDSDEPNIEDAFDEREM